MNQRIFKAYELVYIQTGMGGEKGPNIMEQGIGLALQARYSPSGQGIQMKGSTHSAIQIFRQKGIYITDTMQGKHRKDLRGQSILSDFHE